MEKNEIFTASIGANSTSKIALGFEIPKQKTDEMRDNMKNMDGIDMNPSDRKRGGMGKGKSAGMQGRSKQDFNLWITIQLVEN